MLLIAGIVFMNACAEKLPTEGYKFDRRTHALCALLLQR